MKTLTIIQPWASLIALGEKHIETRSWRTNYRGQLAIHAGKKVDKAVFSQPYYREILEKYGITPENIPTSCVLAVCELKDVQTSEQLRPIISEQEKAFGDYSPNRFGWLLEKISPLENPLPAKGMLGLWECPIPEKESI